jgi:acetylornithine deacetylase/succinyl-diaminopimelate desuccinylase-like protein
VIGIVAAGALAAAGCAGAAAGGGPASSGAATSSPASSSAAASSGSAAPEQDHRLVSLVAEAVRFPTVAGNAEAFAAQKAWLLKTAAELGLIARDAGTMTEIELPGPPGAPVLGLAVHGDVQPVDARDWSVPPFAGAVRNGVLYGRGAADDKGPMVQAMLAMSALRGERRTHTIRLLVGSDEESGSTDIVEYLKTHAPPDYSLVLDAFFPVGVGEKAFSVLAVSAPPEPVAASAGGFTNGSPAGEAIELEAGLGGAIVPNLAKLTLRNPPAGLAAKLRARTPDAGTTLELQEANGQLVVLVHGRAAHSGVNLEGGRNAIVSLARLSDGLLPPSGATQLLEFARFAGEDLYGTSLGLAESDPLWGRTPVNVALVERNPRFLPQLKGRLTLIITYRRSPKPGVAELKDRLARAVAAFNQSHHAALAPTQVFFDEPLVHDPNGKLVQRLLAAYARGTGERQGPGIVSGGTYAKRLPRAIAFGMWFTDKPYPGHDSDEKVSVADLEKGYGVLLETLRDLAEHEPLREPFAP